jgi:hypothetical protein
MKMLNYATQWQRIWAINIVALNRTKVVTSFYNNFKQIIMNTKLLLLAISVAAFSSCTTLYKSGQTPDDVYYSPARPAGGYGEERKEPQKDQVNNNNYNSENRTIRLGINDPRWRYLDNNYSSNLYINDYSYTPYNYGFNYGYYYNPFFWPYPVYGSVFVTPSTPKNTTPRTTNLGAYNPVYNNTHPNTTHGGGIRPVRNYNNNNNGSAVGNVIRQIFSPGTNNNSNNSNSTNNSSTNNNNRTYTPSSSSSSSSSGSHSSGSGSVSRPPRN